MPRKSAKVPVSRDPAVVTARILAAAQAEFMAHGYFAASTNRICRAFGGSKATLFRYFPTKEQLLEAVVRRIAAEWQGAVDWRSIESDEPEVWLATFAERILGWILAAEPIFVGRLAIAERQRLPRLEQTFHATAGRPLLAVAARQLRRWSGEGRMAVADPRRDASHFLDLAISGAVSRTFYGAAPLAGRTLKAHVTRCVTLFLRGCSAV
jgi:AcrR family transcriptional regulator